MHVHIVSGLYQGCLAIWNKKSINIKSNKDTLWCLTDTPPPPLLINFSIFFQSGHSYSNPPAIKFLEKFHPTQAFKIYNHFVLMKIILKCRGSFQPSIYSSPPVIRFAWFYQASQLFQIPFSGYEFLLRTL